MTSNKQQSTKPDESDFATLSNYRHSRRTRKILTHLVRVVCPPDAQRLKLVSEIVDHIELSLRALPTPARLGLIVALVLYDLGSVVTPGSFGRRARSLSESQSKAYFERWWRHPIGPLRELTKGIKSVICMSYCEMPEVKEALGFHSGPWMADTKKKRLTVHADIVARHEEALITPDPLPKGWNFGRSVPSDFVGEDKGTPPSTSGNPDAGRGVQA